MKSHLNSVNDYYNFFNNLEESRVKYKDNFLLSDGIFEVAGREELFWIIELIFCKQQLIHKEMFQSWNIELTKNKELHIIVKNITEQEILNFSVPSKNFYFPNWKIWLDSNLILLPSENPNLHKKELLRFYS